MACNMDCMASKPGILLPSLSQYFSGNLDIILCCSSATFLTRFSFGKLGLGINFLCGSDCMLCHNYWHHESNVCKIQALPYHTISWPDC